LGNSIDAILCSTKSSVAYPAKLGEAITPVSKPFIIQVPSTPISGVEPCNDINHSEIVPLNPLSQAIS
jgi:hypothetical protein